MCVHSSTAVYASSTTFSKSSIKIPKYEQNT